MSSTQSLLMEVVILLTLLIAWSFVLSVNGIEFYEFCPGADAFVTFTPTIQDQSTISWEMFSMDGDEPFCKDGELIPEALQKSQRGRFAVIANRSASKFSATLQIHKIEQLDKSKYIFSLKEHNQSHTTFQILGAYIEVNPPPGKATCVTKPSYSEGWLEIHCNATVDIYREFLMMCFQDGVKAPILHPPERCGTELIAVFWMNNHAPIKCCAYDQVCKKDWASCTDFTLNSHGIATTYLTTDATSPGTLNESSKMTTPDSMGIRNRVRKILSFQSVAAMNRLGQNAIMVTIITLPLVIGMFMFSFAKRNKQTKIDEPC